MDHHGKQLIITDKYFDEAKMRTRQERVATNNPEIPGMPNNTTGTLEQKKTNSWTPVGQATEKSSSPNQLK